MVASRETPEITLERARALMASIGVWREVKDRQEGTIEVPPEAGLSGRAILAPMRCCRRTACESTIELFDLVSTDFDNEAARQGRGPKVQESTLCLLPRRKCLAR